MGFCPSNHNRLYINTLPFSLEEEELEEAIFDILSTYGIVKSVRLVFEGTAMRPKGLCFVEMSSSCEVDEVIDALDGLSVAGYSLEVRRAIPKLVGKKSESFSVVA